MAAADLPGSDEELAEAALIAAAGQLLGDSHREIPADFVAEINAGDFGFTDRTFVGDVPAQTRWSSNRRACVPRLGQRRVFFFGALAFAFEAPLGICRVSAL